MLKKLRIKFIALNMATVAVVIAVVFTIVVAINYQQSVTSVTNALDGSIARAAESQMKDSDQGERSSDKQPDGAGDATAPADGAAAAADGAGVGDGLGSTEESTVAADGASAAALADGVGESTANSSTSSSETSNHGTPPTIGGRERGGDQVIPMAVFSVDSQGNVASIDSNTASISDDVLNLATSELAKKDEGSGTLSDLGLIYMKHNIGGTMYLAFADKSTASSWQTLALTLTGVGLATLVVFLVISIFFSRWALRPVADAWAQQRRFVADASHDLKTPLTVILANTSIALEHPERTVASQAQWLESTQHEAEAMQGLVGDLLTLAKMDEEAATTAAVSAVGGAVPTRDAEKVDLSDLVEGELLQFESIAFERGVEISSDIAPGISVFGSEKRLRRLAMTLIDNACKYVDQSGRIDVTLALSGKRAKLAVRNTGAPISADDLPHVFDRFYRADKARTSGTGGHGLGLAIAYAISEEHGGTLEVESTAAEGTTFTAILPVK
jgi:signal transduction histidine kinase